MSTEQDKRRLDEIVDVLKYIVKASVEVAKNVPEEFGKARNEVLIETYRYLLGHVASSYSVAAGRAVVEAVARYQQPAAPPAPQPAAPVGVETIAGKKLSLVEFVDLLKKKPSSNAEWITVFAYYMKHYEKKEGFTVKELKDYFKAAGLKVPGNLPRDTKTALKKGLIALDLESKRYYITRKGEEFVRGMLSGEE